MNVDDFVHWAVQSLYLALWLSVPVLAVSFFVGLATGVFSAATSIQSDALQFTPKLLAVALALVFFGAWMVAELVHFTQELWQSALMGL